MTDRQVAPRIAVLAYRIWEQEGRQAGCANEHWLRAEKLLEVEFRIGFPDATGFDDAEGAVSPRSG